MQLNSVEVTSCETRWNNIQCVKGSTYPLSASFHSSKLMSRPMQPLLCSSKLSWAWSVVNFSHWLDNFSTRGSAENMCKNAVIKMKVGKTKMYKTNWYSWERDVWAQPFFRSEERMLSKYLMPSDGKQNIKKTKKPVSDGSLNDLLYQTSQGQHCQHVIASDRAKSSPLVQFWAAKHNFQKPLVLLFTTPFDAFQPRLSTKAFKWTWDQDKNKKKNQWMYKQRKNINPVLPHRCEE